jgi:DMSO/TMAO reductase YedYZ molybdopterin-dependent catalytic subunit
LSGLAVAGRIADRYGLVPPDHGGLYGPGATLTYAAQRLLTSHSLAREFSRSQISKPYANPTASLGDAFTRLQAGGFKDWRLSIEGLVARPASLSVDDIKRFAAGRQITEIACEEGWSYVAEWIGTPLADVLHAAGVTPQARYVVYFSMQAGWWDSIDMADALHPQTLVAYAMNDADLPPAFGGPLRLRVPRQLGYKSVKFINRLVVTDSLKGFGKGLGSAAPEDGYAWYAGI